MQNFKAKLMSYVAAAIGLCLIMLICRDAFAGRNRDTDFDAYGADFAALRYPYQQLSEQEQKLYSALYEGVSEYAETISLPGEFTESEYKKVYLLLTTQEPELFYLDTIYETAAVMKQTTLHYQITQADAEEMQKELETAADRVLSAVSPVQTDWQKLLMIHDKIAEHCIYGKTLRSDSAYGCLVQGVAQCEGYAKAFLYVARRAGLNMMCVPGKAKAGDAHIWNVAEINGKYYNFDLTWDDDDKYAGAAAHNCFAVPDADFADHIVDTEIMTPPACTDKMQTFYQVRGLTLPNAAQLQAKLSAWSATAEDMMEFRCADAETFRSVKTELELGGETADLLERVFPGGRIRIIGDTKRNVIVILP